MGVSTASQQANAVQEFRSARFQADMENIRAYLTGRSADLLSYEDVRKKVHARETSRRELKEIPVQAIAGSVGRYKDFTRHFLPLVDEDQERWARIHALADSLQGLPPIEVYQIGEVYFVRDGNHRVSVARSQGQALIEAYVTYVETPVPLEPDIQPDDLILKERYARFLERTKLQETFPDIDLRMSSPGNYAVLEEQIGVHQWWVQQFQEEETTFPAAAARWYQYIYLPVIAMIRKQGMMRDFPDRTETDLYVWIDRHRQELAEKSGWSIDAQTAATDLVETHSQQPQEIVKRIGKKVQKAVAGRTLAAKPEPGVWHESFQSSHSNKQLFPRILVALNGMDNGWLAFGQALQVAQLEKGKLYGLHVVSAEEDKNSAGVQILKREFERRCREADIPGEMSIETGKITETICDRARWTDIVVVSLAQPPGPSAVERLGSNIRKLLRRSPRPVLTIPPTEARLKKMMLAYDGSPKADEALYLTAYLADAWQLPLVVVTVFDKETTEETAAKARTILQQHHVHAAYIQRTGDPAQIIVATAEAEAIDLIVMGGYGQSPLVEVVVGSVIGGVLRQTARPVLVCR